MGSVESDLGSRRPLSRNGMDKVRYLRLDSANLKMLTSRRFQPPVPWQKNEFGNTALSQHSVHTEQ